MLNIYANEEWAIDAKKALIFFISRMGDTKWTERRAKVISYFHNVESIQYGTKEIKTDEKKAILPIAVYEDWIAWYMYLVESIFYRPSCGDTLQSARIFPFFSMIGKNLSTLLDIDGIETKIDELLNEKKNQPDAIFFELAVANLYCKNGWKVCFIPESIFYKSPDLQIRKNGKQYWVECKRMQKVSDYSENERLEWQKRSIKLSELLNYQKLSYYIDITFKVPVADTDENILVDTFIDCLKAKESGKIMESKTSQIEVIIKTLDISSINKNLEDKNIRNNSPEIIEALIGEYISGGNYVTALGYDELYKLGTNKDMDVLNIYVNKIKNACIMKWTNISDHSIDMKAKDIKRLLVKAVNQIPSDNPGIIHIGYENLDGPYVERKRFLKIQNTIQNFDYKDKDIQAIFCNNIQLLATSNNFDWAETACFYKKSVDPNLKNHLLLADSIDKFNQPHWEEDIYNLEKKDSED
ncbi:hypothetical protein SAMN05421786_105104 [Chryseobacterium ureilyticum]|uniref:Uncharacterized protein n=1 Tax=Chryseobacterium ureilyticum TaxID=373668 RepID=A0A1N7PE98_9FLAO|nr:hypothetical protein [Chryseobacterium ureilyticum]SIT08942.1 hypothetical protein SAMN05421786_105104 [Chryseobacterium ureilyticum]